MRAAQVGDAVKRAISIKHQRRSKGILSAKGAGGNGGPHFADSVRNDGFFWDVRRKNHELPNSPPKRALPVLIFRSSTRNICQPSTQISPCTSGHSLLICFCVCCSCYAFCFKSAAGSTCGLFLFPIPLYRGVWRISERRPASLQRSPEKECFK